MAEELDHDVVGDQGEVHPGGVEGLDEGRHDGVHEAREAEWSDCHAGTIASL